MVGYLVGCTAARQLNLIKSEVWLFYWCGREDSNFHGSYPTATSTLRVYQFRHDRTALARVNGYVASRFGDVKGVFPRNARAFKRARNRAGIALGRP